MAVLSLSVFALAGLVPLVKADDTSSDTSEAVTSASTDVPSSVSSAGSWMNPVTESTLPVHFGLAVSETYDDNILLQPVKTSDYVTRIMPSLDYTIGNKEAANANFLSLSLQPTVVFYAQNSSINSVEENAAIAYSHSFTRLTLGITQSYDKSANPSIYTNNIIKQKVYSTAITADYDYSDKLSLHNTTSQVISTFQTPGQADVNQWSINTFFLYALTSKLKIGAGPNIGFVDQQYSPNQTYEEAVGHLEYDVTGKINVTLSAGLSTRQYQYGYSEQLTPVFSLQGNWAVTDSTNITVGGQAATYSSPNLQSETYQATSFNIGVQQRFLQKFNFNFNVGYENDDYTNLNTSNNVPHREDNYYFFRTGVQWFPNDWLSAGISYSFSQDASTYSTSCFTDNQLSFRVGARY